MADKTELYAVRYPDGSVSLYVDGAQTMTVIFMAVEATLTVLFAYGARKLRAAQEA